MIKLTNALADFDLADQVELDCGSFDIKIRQAAIHNESFRASIAKKSLQAKKKSLAPERGTVTGNYEEDVELFIDHILIGWGKRPLVDDDGDEVPFTKENLTFIFTETKQGKVLFSKIQTAALDDELFIVTEDDLKN